MCITEKEAEAEGIKAKAEAYSFVAPRSDSGRKPGQQKNKGITIRCALINLKLKIKLLYYETTISLWANLASSFLPMVMVKIPST